MCTTASASLAGLRHGTVGEVLANLGVGDVVVDEVAVEVAVVRTHIYQAVSGEVEEYNLFFARLGAFLGLADCGSDGMR